MAAKVRDFLETYNRACPGSFHPDFQFGSLHCLQILVSSGASIHLKDDAGRNAAQIAHESGQKLILGYLALAESCFQLAQLGFQNDARLLIGCSEHYLIGQ